MVRKSKNIKSFKEKYEALKNLAGRDDILKAKYNPETFEIYWVCSVGFLKNLRNKDSVNSEVKAYTHIDAIEKCWKKMVEFAKEEGYSIRGDEFYYIELTDSIYIR